NWVEGLTTYLANYYWHELTGDEQQAMEQRRLMVEGYSLYVEPEQDYPVSRFFTKEDEKDNAIGYHKAAFIFHHLRHELGEEPFWRGLKTFVQRYRNQPADWSDIEAVFTQESGRDLRWFFDQWVEQGGAPQVSLEEVRAYQVQVSEEPGRWRVLVRMGQSGRPFQMAVPLRVVLDNGTETKWIRLGPAAMTREEVSVSARPLAVQVDPQWMVFRRIPRSRLTPMLNGYVTDSRRTVGLLSTEGGKVFQPILDRIAERESPWPESRKTVIVSFGEMALPPAGSMLVLGGADQRHRIEPLVKESCGDLVRFREEGVDVKGRTYEGPETAVLLTCRRVAVPASVVTVLYSLSPGAVERLAPYLFYYGWHSYVVFKNGTVVERGVWQDGPEMKEVEVNDVR
ncbi:MAG: M1 family aminopeptidase, partial [Nitrospira sp.]